MLFCLCTSLLVLSAQCDEDDEARGSCGPAAVIAPSFYNSSESNGFDILNAEIFDNCLTVEFSSGGCDGSSWSLVLVDSGAIAESNPEQRYLKFIFDNAEECEALLTQTRSFDLVNIQLDGRDTVLLNIEGIDGLLTYTY